MTDQVYVLPFHTSTMLNDDVDENNIPISRTDFHCASCGNKVKGGYAIRYLLCDKCLKPGSNPALSVHKTSKDKL